MKNEETRAPGFVASGTPEGDGDVQDLAPAVPEQALVHLASGRRVAVSQGPCEMLTVYHPSGQVEVSIQLTPEGAVLSMAASAINLRTAGDINIACDRFRVHSRGAIDIHTDGDFHQQIEGTYSTEATGPALITAREVTLRTEGGDMNLEAEQDVWVNGERVMINC